MLGSLLLKFLKRLLLPAILDLDHCVGKARLQLRGKLWVYQLHAA